MNGLNDYVTEIVADTQETLPAVTGPTPGLPPVLVGELDRTLTKLMADGQLVGLAAGILRDGDIAGYRLLGWEDREKRIPVTMETRFRWASCAKPVTAIAALQLVEQQRLDLDADIRTYVPEFPDKHVKITARHLMTHQSGIVHYTNGQVIRTQAVYTAPHPFAEVILAMDRFKESPLLHAPGLKHSYTTHGYILLSAAVQRAGKAPFRDQVAARIARPLGMTSFVPDEDWTGIPHRAAGYRLVKGKVVRSTDTDVSWKLGGGGYVSTVEDFARFARGLLQHKLLRRETEELAWTPQPLADGKATGYGLGFNIAYESEKGTGTGKTRVVSHGGAQEKTRTHFVVRPLRGTAIVLMSNSENAVTKDLIKAVEAVVGR